MVLESIHPCLKYNEKNNDYTITGERQGRSQTGELTPADGKAGYASGEGTSCKIH